MAETNGKPKAFVLGMTPNGLGVVRSLGRQGVPVVAIHPRMESTMYSKYCEGMVFPDVEFEENRFLEMLLDIGRRLDQPGILFPTGDAYVNFVSKNREVLSQYFKYALPEKDVLQRLLNKKTQYTLVKKLDIPLPNTFYPANYEELEKISCEINYPVIVKPALTTEWRKKFPVKKVEYANTPEDLLKAYQSIQELNIEAMIQEVVLGTDSNNCKVCTYMNKDSEPILVFTLKKLRNFPCRFGVGSVVESAFLPEVAELGLRFLKGVEYVGVGSIEFKKDNRDNKLKMIELNSRLWLQNSLPERCGMNFPYTMYMDLTGEKVKPRDTCREGVKWVSMRMDYASFRGYHSMGELSYGEWINSLRGEKVFEVFSWDDPKPFFQATGYGLKVFQKGFRKLFG